MTNRVYNAKNVFTLIFVFVLLIWLLYSLGTFFHRTAKFHAEIEAIEAQNLAIQEEILQKERHIEYLRTAERIDKEAKIQLGRKKPGEEVLVFIDERQEILAENTESTPNENAFLDPLSIPERWTYLLFQR